MLPVLKTVGLGCDVSKIAHIFTALKKAREMWEKKRGAYTSM